MFQIKKLAPILVFTLFPFADQSIGCATCSEEQWGYPYHFFSEYTVSNIKYTPEGIAYDDIGVSNFDGALIDKLTDYTEACLHAQFPNGTIPPAVAQAGECVRNSFSLPIDRKSFVVKVAADCVLDCSTQNGGYGINEVLPRPLDVSECKGSEATAQCPCRFRAGVECANVPMIVSCPALYLYQDALLRLLTSCINNWSPPELSACASPQTTPLSPGF